MIRKFLLLLLTVCLFLGGKAQTAAIFEGQIKNAKAPYIILTGNASADTIKLAEDGSFSFSIDCPKGNNYSVNIPQGAYYDGIYLQNGLVSRLEFDADSHGNGTKYGGTAKFENTMLTTQFLNFRSRVKEPVTFNQYKAAGQHIADSLLSVIRKHGNKVFTEYEKNILKDEVQSFAYGFQDNLMANSRPLDSDKEFNVLMNSIDINNPREGRTYSYILWKSLCRLNRTGDDDRDLTDMLKVVGDEITNQDVRDEFGLRFSRMIFVSPELRNRYDEVYELAKNIVSEKVAVKLKNYYEANTRKTGSPAPNFEVMTPDDQRSMFHEHLNKKITYIDIWSTWCGPCCEEIPYIAKLVEKYKDNPDIEFVSISIDHSLDSWKRYIKQHEGWKQLVIPNEQRDAFLKLIGINGIPRFLVFTGDKTIIDVNAPRPSDEKFEVYLENLLK